MGCLTYFRSDKRTSLYLLKNDLINYTIQYSRIRVDCYFVREVDKDAMEDLRGAKHNTFI